MEQAVPTAHASADPATRRLRPPTPRAALVLVAAAALAAVVLTAASAAKPFLLGAVLVYLLAPLVELFARLRVPRFLAVLLVFAIAITAVAGVATLALTPLLQQMRLFVDDLPEIVAGLRAALTQFYADLSLDAEVREAINLMIANAVTSLAGFDLGAIVAPLVDSLVAVVSTITAYAILPAWLFFVLKDRIRLSDALERSLPIAWRGDAFAVLAISNRVFGNWIRGQIILGFVVGIASYLGLMALSIVIDPVFARYAVLLAIIAGLLELVPFIGPIIAAIPPILIGLTVGPEGFIAAFLLYLGIQQLENNLLVPKIQGDAVELHPSAVMFALVIGASLGGILGAIVSLPIAAASRDVFRYLFSRVSDPPVPVDVALTRISPKLPRTLRRSVLETAGVPAMAATPAPAGPTPSIDESRPNANGTVAPPPEPEPEDLR